VVYGDGIFVFSKCVFDPPPASGAQPKVYRFNPKAGTWTSIEMPLPADVWWCQYRGAGRYGYFVSEDPTSRTACRVDLDNLR